MPRQTSIHPPSAAHERSVLPRAASAPKLLGVGGAHLDRRGRLTGPFIPGASIPGRISEDVGGGVFNALRVAANHGARCSLFSIRGGDASGETVARAVREAGIGDLSAVFLDRATASYTAFVSEEGEVVAALADMELYEIGFPRQMRRMQLKVAIDDADSVLCDANLPASALEALAKLATGKSFFAIAISPAKAVRLGAVLRHLQGLFLNAREAAALLPVPPSTSRDRLHALAAAGLGSAVVTDGARAVTAFDAGGMFSLQPPAPRRVVDVTGAGDALAGGTVAMLAMGLSLAEALRHGIAAANLAVESERSVPDASHAAFTEALARVPAAEPLV